MRAVRLHKEFVDKLMIHSDDHGKTRKLRRNGAKASRETTGGGIDTFEAKRKAVFENLLRCVSDAVKFLSESANTTHAGIKAAIRLSVLKKTHHSSRSRPRRLRKR